MPLDTSIIGRLNQPQMPNQFNNLQQALQIKSLNENSDLNELKAQEYQRGVTQANNLRSALMGAKTPEEQAGVYASFGDSKGAAELLTGRAKLAEIEAKTRKENNDVIGSLLGSVYHNPTMETVKNALTHANELKILSPEQIRSLYGQYTKASEIPDGIQKLAQVHYGAAVNAEKQLPTTMQQNLGNTSQVISTSPFGGMKVLGSSEIGQSPDSVASNATTRRGQNMVDARAKELNGITLSKPFEVTGQDGKPMLVQQNKAGQLIPVEGYAPKDAEKPMTDSQSKALLFGSRMTNSAKIISDLENSGVLKSIPMSTTGFGIGSTINAMQPKELQQLDQAKRDFVNALLRRESGAVISKAEFDDANKQYFPQIGEAKDVVAQKTKNREIAVRGILAEVPRAHQGKVGEIIGGQPTKPYVPSGAPSNASSSQEEKDYLAWKARKK